MPHVVYMPCEELKWSIIIVSFLKNIFLNKWKFCFSPVTHSAGCPFLTIFFPPAFWLKGKHQLFLVLDFAGLLTVRPADPYASCGFCFSEERFLTQESSGCKANRISFSTQWEGKESAPSVWPLGQAGAFHAISHLIFQQPWEGRGSSRASRHWRGWRLPAEEQLAQGSRDGGYRAEICEFSIEITVWETLEEF